jgi:hypothetical protein
VLKKLCLYELEQPFTASSVPASVTNIELDHYSIPLEDALPAALRRLSIDNSLSRIWLTTNSFRGCPQLRTLDVRWADINQIPVGCLPPSLTSLQLPLHEWNEKLMTGSLPAGLKRLTTGAGYRHDLQPGLLPDGLRWLLLRRSFNAKLVRGSLPSSLRQLRIAGNKKNDVELSVIEPAFNQSLLDVFARSSESFAFSASLSTLRSSRSRCRPDCSCWTCPVPPTTQRSPEACCRRRCSG